MADCYIEPCIVLYCYRWFKVCQVSMASEKVMRKRAKEVIGDGAVVEKVALTFSLKVGKRC